jgi:hypothetical protein
VDSRDEVSAPVLELAILIGLVTVVFVLVFVGHAD